MLRGKLYTRSMLCRLKDVVFASTRVFVVSVLHSYTHVDEYEVFVENVLKNCITRMCLQFGSRFSKKKSFGSSIVGSSG